MLKKFLHSGNLTQPSMVDVGLLGMLGIRLNNCFMVKIKMLRGLGLIRRRPEESELRLMSFILHKSSAY